jgi:hypothetical protein
MPSFTRLIRFESAEERQIYFADLGADVVEPPSEGSSLRAYASFNDLLAGKSETVVTLGKVMTLPKHTYCRRQFRSPRSNISFSHHSLIAESQSIVWV